MIPTFVPGETIRELFDAIHARGFAPADCLFTSYDAPAEPLFDSGVAIVRGDELRLFGAQRGRYYSIATPAQVLAAEVRGPRLAAHWHAGTPIEIAPVAEWRARADRRKAEAGPAPALEQLSMFAVRR